VPLGWVTGNADVTHEAEGRPYVARLRRGWSRPRVSSGTTLELFRTGRADLGTEFVWRDGLIAHNKPRLKTGLVG
jgi:hypothetical protein